MNPPNNIPSSNPQAIVDLLGQIMALPEGDRAALRSAWQAMDPVTAVGTASVVMGSEDPGALRDQGKEISPSELAKSVGDWIESLKSLPPEKRLEELETALAQEDDEGVALQLQRAISDVLNSNKALAAKVALFRYAYDHPFMSLAGVLGLLGTVVLIAKGIIFKIF